MELILLYIWMRLNIWIGISIGLVILFGFMAIIFGIMSGDAREPSQKQILKRRAWRLVKWGSIPCFLFALLCPSAKETAVLVAGHYAIKLSSSVEGQKVKTLLQLTANNMLDDAIKSQTRK